MTDLERQLWLARQLPEVIEIFHPDASYGPSFIWCSTGEKVTAYEWDYVVNTIIVNRYGTMAGFNFNTWQLRADELMEGLK